MMKAPNIKKLAMGKTAVRCKEGPFAKQILWLTTPCTTLTFTIKGQAGFYAGGRWNVVS